MNWLHLAMLFAPLVVITIGGIICEYDWFDRFSDRIGFPLSEDDWVD